MIMRSLWSGPKPGLRPRQTALFAVVTALTVLAAGCGSDPSPGPEGDPDPCDAAETIEVGNTGNGSLTSGDCRGADGRYTDRWSLHIPQDMMVRIGLSSQQFDTWLELQDARGNGIAMNDDAGGTLNSMLMLQLSAGDYRIVATSFQAGATGSYRLEVEEAVECAPVGTVSVGETVRGTLTAEACYWEYGTQAQNWNLSIASAQEVRIALDSDDFEEGVLVRESGGTILYGEQTSGPGGRAQFDIRLEPGSYTVIVTTIMEGMTGDYELSVSEAPACGPGTGVELDLEVTGELTDDDCAVMGFGAADSYTLGLDAETPLDFVLKSADFPPVVLVRDEGGMDVALGYEYTTTGTALARAVLGAGSYEIFTTSYFNGARGEYRLTVSEMSCTEPQEIRPGDTVSGTITEQDCLLDDYRFRDSWSLVLDSATTVQIDLTSSDFDAYLVLRDADGTEIEADDDGGAGTNARIVRELDAATYEVLASTWGNYQFGGYQLEVSETTVSAAATSLGTSLKSRPGADAPARSPAPQPRALWWGEHLRK